MSQQLSLLDGAYLRDGGIAAVERSNAGWVDLMRVEAARVCHVRGSATADDLRQHAASLKRAGIEGHPNAWGTIFRPGFECIGFEPSRYPRNHCRVIRRWRLAR